MHPLFELLHRNDLIKRNKPNISVILGKKRAKLYNIIEEASNITLASNIYESSTLFTHTASLGLSGGRADCFHYNCRLKKLNEFVRYASLYCDKVFIQNYLSDFSYDYGRVIDLDLEDLRIEIIYDIYLLIMIKPLIESGIIVPFTNDFCYCDKCLSEKIVKQRQSQIKKLKASLSQEILENVDVHVLKTSKGYQLNCSSKKEYYEHKKFSWYREISAKELVYKPLLDHGKSVHMSKNYKKKLKLHTAFANEIVNTLTNYLIITEAFNTTYLTNRPVDIELLNKINPEFERHNELYKNKLSIPIPFLSDVPIKNLLQLRNREKESFIEFRSAINKLMKEFYENPTLSRKDTSYFYYDVIEPRIASLEKKFTDAKKDILRNVSTSFLTNIAIIIGAYSALSNNSSIIEFLGALGLFKGISDSTKEIVDYATAEKNIRNDNLYFLWKVKKLNYRQKSYNNILI